MPDFSPVIERGGDPATRGQIADMCHRYRWASGFCRQRRILEVGCGTGQGLGMLIGAAQSATGCDVDPAAISAARATYGDRVPLHASSADHLPAANGSVDVVLMLEGIYYLPDVGAFLRECRRVLRPGGQLLLTTTNKDVFDFAPSPLSHTYFGAAELPDLLDHHGFSCEIFGYSQGDSLPWRHRALRPVKALAQRLGLVPRTMRGKARLRRMIFGPLPIMPRDLSTVAQSLPYQPPVPVPARGPDRAHRYLYVVATKRGG